MVEEYKKMQEEVNEARVAVFLERASVAAYRMCDKNVTTEVMDQLRKERNHWIKEIKEIVK